MKNIDCAKTIDKVYIDGPCELLIRRSIDKLLAEHFCNQEIPGPNGTANISVGKFQSPTILYRSAPIGPIYISESCDSNGPSMYTLPIAKTMIGN